MLSPTFSYSRMAPPVRPSRSLEGLERVVPPSPKSPFPRELFLNKPLPAKPFEQPESSAMWSDSSDSESTLDSITASEPRNSADSYPIFVSGSDDFGDLADHPAPSADLSLPVSPLPPLKCTDAIDIDRSINLDESIVQPPSVSSSLDTKYERSSHWNQRSTGANHYFREKKWDYFPELATPSALQASGRVSPNMVAQSKPRKKGNMSALEFAKGKYRWHSLDRGGLGGVRDSIKTYVHRTLSRDGPAAEHKPKEAPRPATAPMDHRLNDASSFLGPKGWEAQPSSLALDTNAAVRAISVGTSPSPEYDYTKKMFHLQTPISPTFSTYPASPVSPTTPTTPRQKQPAVPLSPYQKYGPAIWEPKKSKRNVQCLKHQASPTLGPSASSAPELSFANATPPLSPPLKQFQQNTRGVFLEAKKKIAGSKEDRRREQLKAQIKLVGPVNPHTYVQSNPWV
jgi:hypothetical protein